MADQPQRDLQKAHKRRKSRESLLETLESIVVAFVLAFIFRAFIVEAFVIPTGSMGPTLYGAHVEFACSDCGNEFAMGAEGVPAVAPVCPNCYLRQHIPPQGVTGYSGDRILVLKFLYDFEEPKRWDVIVFRNPNEPSQNYIKRLVALPGETIEMVRGDVTIDGEVAHKTDVAQEALWILVHDTRYRPTRREWKPRWIGRDGWQVHESGFVLEKALDADRTAWLTYLHRNDRNVPDNIRDFYAYNTGSNGGRLNIHACTDLSLKAEVTAETPASVAVVEMRAYKDRFRFELTAKGSEAPTRILINGKVVAAAEGGVLPVGRVADVQVANVDRKVVLVVDGRRVATNASVPVTAEGDPLYEPTPISADERRVFGGPANRTPEGMASEVRVGGHGGGVRLGYLRLDRDVYYINENIQDLVEGSVPGHGVEGNPFALREDEFFVCGDNSPKSFDCRLWPLDRPVVPRRNLVGKAFFVYWPAAGTRYRIPLAPDPTGWRLVH